ncbi:MAG: hypothetical protein AB9897_00935 [Anaerolineaceae bacterium]
MQNSSSPGGAKNPLKNRTAVQRRHAPTYLLLTLLSFAFSVTATRVFLNLTGFPQLGGGGLHIAHVLWGGLFLFAASLLPLILVNQWALQLSSILAGIGVGLFIDEIGKFITSTNDYFFPSAAPIIYAFFLLTVLVFIQVKHQRQKTPRETMYEILEDFAEVLDRDLSQAEYDSLNAQLVNIITKSKEDQIVTLAKSLHLYLEEHKGQVVPHDPGLIERFQDAFKQFQIKWLTRKKMKVILLFGLLLWAGWALSSQTIMYLNTHNTDQFAALAQHFINDRLILNPSGMGWFGAQIILEGFMGLISLFAATLFLFKKEKLGTWVGVIDMIVTLVVVNLLTFYFDQFSTIAFAVYQFILLVLLLYYDRQYLSPKVYRHHNIKSGRS